MPLSALYCDRIPLQRRTFALAQHLDAGNTVPPIHVEHVGDGVWRILDGRHRFTAHKLLGRKEILARYGSAA